MKYIKPINLIKKYLKSSEYKKVLVIGGGDGKEVDELAIMGYEIHAIDPTYTKPLKNVFITHAKKIENILLKKDSFDVVVALNSLQFVEDFEKQVKKIQNSLKPGGIIIIRLCLMNEYSKFFPKNVAICFNKLIPIFIKDYWMRGKPHRGTPFAHSHYMIDFVAQK